MVCPCCLCILTFSYTLTSSLSLAFLNQYLLFLIDLGSPLPSLGLLLLVEFSPERLVGCSLSYLAVLFFQYLPFLLEPQIILQACCALDVSIPVPASPASLPSTPSIPTHPCLFHSAIKVFICFCHLFPRPLLIFFNSSYIMLVPSCRTFTRCIYFLCPSPFHLRYIYIYISCVCLFPYSHSPCYFLIPPYHCSVA